MQKIIQKKNSNYLPRQMAGVCGKRAAYQILVSMTTASPWLAGLLCGILLNLATRTQVEICASRGVADPGLFLLLTMFYETSVPQFRPKLLYLKAHIKFDLYKPSQWIVSCY